MVYVKWFLPSKQTASLYIIIILHQTATGWYSPSIHAPAGGATRSPSQVVLTMMFQFTRPQGARLAWSLTLILLYGFNSRARRGRDRYAWFCVLAGSVSIHAPAGGATQSSQTSRLGTKFQFTRPQGARLQEYFNAQRTGEFQFTRPQGARRLCKIIGAICVCFNSRARRGRDHIGHLGALIVARFNSRARRGRDALWRA